MEREGEIEGPVSTEEQENIFQASYRSTMECRSSQPHGRGHGCMPELASGSERMRAELDEQARAHAQIQRKMMNSTMRFMT